MFGFITKKYCNMNDKTRKEVIEWCETWDNNKCQKCSTAFSELEKQAQVIEEITGQKRILPVYTADHKDGDSSHLDGYIDVDWNNKPIDANSDISPRKQVWHKFGNMRRFCWSCNRLEGIIKRKTIRSEKFTREKLDRVTNEDTFIFEAENQINERGDVCYVALCKAGKNICDSSEVTCKRYFDTEIRTAENPSGKFRKFAYSCEGQFCNGEHVSWANIKPDKIIEREKKQLEREWLMQFPELKTDADIRQWEMTVGFGRKYINKEHFINERLKFTWE